MDKKALADAEIVTRINSDVDEPYNPFPLRLLDIGSLAASDVHFTRSWVRSQPLKKKDKGYLGESTAFGLLRGAVGVLGYKPESLVKLTGTTDTQTVFVVDPATGIPYLDYLPEEPYVQLWESHQYPDILFLGNERPFLFEVRNLWVYPGYELVGKHFVAGKDGVGRKAWSQRFYPIRDHWRGHTKIEGSVVKWRNGKSERIRKAVDLEHHYGGDFKSLIWRAYVSTVPWYEQDTWRGILYSVNSLHFSNHPLIPDNYDSENPECVIEHNYRLGRQLEELIKKRENRE